MKKYLPLFFTFIFVSISCLTSKAQITLSGKVITYDSIPVQNAKVLLHSALDSSFLNSAITDVDGRFTFTITGVEKQNATPTSINLHQNYPNPFNDVTTISFESSKPTQVRIDVFDMLGRNVRTLANGFFESGNHAINWDAANSEGLRVPYGVYFCTMKTAHESITRKILYSEYWSAGLMNTQVPLFKRNKNTIDFDRAFLIDVIDTLLSVPRFETRIGTIIHLTKDTLAIIKVFPKGNDRWTFFGYQELQAPLKIYEPYIYAFTPDGLGRKNIRIDASRWEIFKTKDIVGDRWQNIKYKTDYIIWDNNHDSIIVSFNPDNLFDPVIYRTINGGLNWSMADSGLLEIDPYKTQIYSLLKMNQRLMCAGTPFYDTKDFGLLWKYIPGIGFGGYINVLEQNPFNKNVIIAGGETFMFSSIYLAISTDSGKSWKNLSGKFSFQDSNLNQVWSVSFDQKDSSIYLVTTDAIFHTNDLGETWNKSYDTGFGYIMVHPIKINHAFFHSFVHGLLETSDGGNTWIYVNSPCKNLFSRSNIAYDSFNNALFIFFADGLWRYRLD